MTAPAPPTAPSAPAPGFAARLWNGAVVMLIFVAVGPPVGAAVFLGLFAVWIARDDPASIATLFAFTALFGLPMSYMVGAAPAALTGLVFAVWQSLRGRVTATGAAAIGVLSGLAFGGLIAEPEDADGAPMLALGLLTCFAATMVCWALARSFVTPRAGA